MNKRIEILFISVALISVTTLLPRSHCRFGNLSLPPDRGKFGYEITRSVSYRILILKFGFYGETKTGADSSRQNIILNDLDMKTGMDIYMDI